MDEAKKAVVVVGMHRSGTSLVTRLLSLWDLALPIDDIGAQRGNELGHWESGSVIEFNDSLLSSVESSWADVSIPEIDAVRGDVLERMSESLHRAFGDAPRVVIKDPRISKLASLWVESLPKLGYDASFVVAVRNPIEVADSLSRRDSLPRGQGALLWLVSTLESERATRTERRAFVDYGDLMSDWRASMGRVGSVLFPESPEPPAEGDDVIDPGVRHHAAGAARSLETTLGRWFEEVYEATCQLVHDPHSNEAMTALDRIRTEVAGAGELLGSGFSDDARAAHEALRVERERAGELASMLEYRTADLDRLNNEITTLRAAHLVAVDAAIAADREAGTARAESAELLAQLNAANHQLDMFAPVGSELAALKSSRALRLSHAIIRATAPIRRLLR